MKQRGIEGVITLMDVIEEDEYFMLVLEDGGCDLFNFTTECHEKIALGTMRISDWRATTKRIAIKLARIIRDLHDVNLCHLDLSLENVLIENVQWVQIGGNGTDSSFGSDANEASKYKKIDDCFRLKVIDFGAARYVDDEHRLNLKQVIGKISYCAPRVFEKKSFDPMKADCWTFGVSLFTLSVGANPWGRPDMEQNKLYHKMVVEDGMEEILTIWKRREYMDETIGKLLKQIFVLEEKDRVGMDQIVQGLE